MYISTNSVFDNSPLPISIINRTILRRINGRTFSSTRHYFHSYLVFANILENSKTISNGFQVDNDDDDDNDGGEEVENVEEGMAMQQHLLGNSGAHLNVC